MMTSLVVVVEGSLPATGMNQLLSSNKKIIYICERIKYLQPIYQLFGLLLGDYKPFNQREWHYQSAVSPGLV
jgi:hypothetical protein